MIAIPSLSDILERTVAGERLSDDDALRLLQSHDLAALGRAADEITRKLHPESYRTYNIDRNINYTNVCTAVCHFCAFYRSPKSDEGYVLDRDVLLQKNRRDRRTRRRSDPAARRTASRLSDRVVRRAAARNQGRGFRR